MKPYCPDCGHQSTRHEGSAVDEFASAHGGVGYAFCQEVIRAGESASVCGCRRLVGGHGDTARGRLWPAERPEIATIPAPGPPLRVVRLVSTEVTTTDPLNGQPDFEHVEITYEPTDLLVDTKSLKAYWRWWRGHGASMERLATLVTTDVARATGARRVEVIVREAPRGGISIEATSAVGVPMADAAPVVPDPRSAHSNGRTPHPVRTRRSGEAGVWADRKT